MPFRCSRVGCIALTIFAGTATCAVLTTHLPDGAVVSWNTYIAAVEASDRTQRPLLGVSGREPKIVDLNANGEIAGGYIHDWIGSIQIPGATVAQVRAVLENYESYPEVYAPELKTASATRMRSSNGQTHYDVKLVTEQVEQFAQHFAFEIHSRVDYRVVNGQTLVESRSYSIQESDSGRAPYTDLLPEGSDHGILWRLNSYWRLRQMGSAVYAECEAVTLSRRPLFGMHDQVKTRTRQSLQTTLRKTRDQFAGSTKNQARV